MISWAIAWTNAKIVNEYLSFYNLIFLRFCIGSLCLLPLVIKTKINSIYYNKTILYVLSASILFFIYNIAFFKGTYYGQAGKGAVFVTTVNPIITIIITILINKKIYVNEIIGILIGVLGGLLIMNVFNEGFSILIDIQNIYFVFCAISWGIMTVVAKYGQQRLPSIQFIFWCYLITTIIAFPFSNLNEIILTNLDSRFYLNFFLVSVGAMSFGTSIYIYATSIIGPVKSSVFIFSVPFLALGFANIILGEILSINVIIGGLLSILAIYVVNKKS